jgi:hypothetical protein
LSGCALTPPSDTENDRLAALATSTELDAKLDTLADRLARQCDNTEQTQRLEEQQQRLVELNSELDSSMARFSETLRGLQADVQSFAGESSPPEPQCPVGDVEALQNKTLLGRNEWVGFPNIGTYLKARIDSGANTASLSARDITEFEREGEDWIRFKLALDENDVVIDGVRDEWIEAPIERRVRVIQASGEESRPVVSLLMQLGPIKQNVDFTLNDRSHLDYPVLLGRRFMMDIALIDVARRYIYDRPEYPGGEPAAQAEADEAEDARDEQE